MWYRVHCKVELKSEMRGVTVGSIDGSLGSETLSGWTEMTKNETNIETTPSKLAVEHDLH